MRGIWGSYYNIPKAIFYLLKGYYKRLGLRAPNPQHEPLPRILKQSRGAYYSYPHRNCNFRFLLQYEPYQELLLTSLMMGLRGLQLGTSCRATGSVRFYSLQHSCPKSGVYFSVWWVHKGSLIIFLSVFLLCTN